MCVCVCVFMFLECVCVVSVCVCVWGGGVGVVLVCGGVLEGQPWSLVSWGWGMGWRFTLAFVNLRKGGNDNSKQDKSMSSQSPSNLPRYSSPCYAAVL